MRQTLKIPSEAARSAYFSAYLGPWSMLDYVLDAAVARIASIDLVAHLDQRAARAEIEGPKGSSYSYDLTPGGVAVIDVVGTLMKQESSLGDSTSTVMLRRTIRAAGNNPQVLGLAFRIDSPGGSTAGTEDCAEEIYQCDKPTMAFGDGLCASAAYWLASQCDSIAASSTAVVGSIGTYMVVRDTSAASAAQGVKIHVVKSSEAKGAGVPGSEVTAKQLAEWQRMIDDSQAVFTAAVARGRGVSIDQAKTMADARVHVGASAKSAGLVDDVESFDAALARFEASLSPAAPIQAPTTPKKSRRSALLPVAPVSDAPDATSVPDAASSADPIHPPSPAPARAGAPTQTAPDAPAAPAATTQGPPMSNADKPATPTASTAPVTEPRPATIAELRTAFPAHPAFALDSAEKALTLTEAQASFAGVLAAENAKLREENTALASKAPAPAPAAPAAEAPVKRPGVPALRNAPQTQRSTHAYGDSDAASQFVALVDDEMKANAARVESGKYTKIDAVAAVARKNPELHAEYIESNQHVLRR